MSPPILFVARGLRARHDGRPMCRSNRALASSSASDARTGTSAVFADGEQFDVDRDNADQHLSFGYGPHVCPGATLARAVARIGIAGVLRSVPAGRGVARTRASRSRTSPPSSRSGPRRLAGRAPVVSDGASDDAGSVRRWSRARVRGRRRGAPGRGGGHPRRRHAGRCASPWSVRGRRVVGPRGREQPERRGGRLRAGPDRTADQPRLHGIGFLPPAATGSGREAVAGGRGMGVLHPGARELGVEVRMHGVSPSGRRGRGLPTWCVVRDRTDVVTRLCFSEPTPHR